MPAPKHYLGIEGGGTRTVAFIVDAHGRFVRRLESGPANLKLLTDDQLYQRLREIALASPKPIALCIGLAGAWSAGDCRRIHRAAGRLWTNTPCHATNDLETALAAAQHQRGDSKMAQVLILSGTGSSCYARRRDGQSIKVGGWGHVLGDKGSGYEIAVAALKAVIEVNDRTGKWPNLGTRFLRALQLNEPIDLIGWAQSVGKAEISRLAVEVFAARHDPLARAVLQEAAARLAQDATTCARRIVRPGTAIEFLAAGSNLMKQAGYRALLFRELRRLWPNARLSYLKRESVWGAVELARRLHAAPGPQPPLSGLAFPPTSPASRPLVISRRLSPTEERNPRSMKLDRLPVARAVRLMLSEEARVPILLRSHAPQITKVVSAVVRAFKQGGRLFYIGAGTSGRLGVLDASECPPTFRCPPEMVQGIIAGGQRAIFESVEGAEDDVSAGAQALRFREVGSRDVVVGIAASGTTPFVWGALREARRHRATTVLLCFNPYLKIPRELRPDVLIAPGLGPEFLTGSTRLKSGTATKLILNIFTTLAMVKIGKVVSNLMVDLNPANVKLRHRATRIVEELTGVDSASAAVALERSGWVIKKAIARLRR